MKRYLSIALAIIVLIALWVGYKHQTEQAPFKSADSTVHDAGLITREKVVVESGEQGFRAPGSQKPLDSRRLKRLSDEYRCQREVDCERSVISAATPEEAAWLARNGYPSESRLSELQAMSPSQLEKLALAKDLAAMAVYGEHLVKSGEIDRGLAQLHLASVNGSVFAAYKLAETYKTQDIGESAAYYRLAYIEGDWKASTQLFMDRPDITAAELNSADQRAMVLYSRLMERKAKERLPMQVSVRPFED